MLNTTNGLRQQDADIHRLDLVTLEFLEIMWNRVCHHDLQTQITVITSTMEKKCLVLTSSIGDASRSFGASADRSP